MDSNGCLTAGPLQSTGGQSRTFTFPPSHHDGWKELFPTAVRADRVLMDLIYWLLLHDLFFYKVFILTVKLFAPAPVKLFDPKFKWILMEPWDRFY